MSILEILEDHRQHDAVAKDTRFYCLCGWVSEMPRYRYGPAEHRAHQAQVLEQHEREREAAALEEAAHAIASAEINLEIFEGQDHLKELWAHSNRTRVGIVTSLRERAARLKATP